MTSLGRSRHVRQCSERAPAPLRTYGISLSFFLLHRLTPAPRLPVGGLPRRTAPGPFVAALCPSPERPSPLRIGCRALQPISLHIPRKAARRLMGRTSGLPCSGPVAGLRFRRACRSWCADVAVPQQLLERSDVVAALEGMRHERVAEGVGRARLGRPPCQTAACLSARRRTVSCRWWRWRCPVTQSRWIPGSGTRPRLRIPPIADGPCRRAPLAVDAGRL